MSTLDLVADDATTAGLRLLRAVPRGDGRLLLAVRERDGAEVAAQWYADPARCRDVARRTHSVAPEHVERVGDRLLLQRHGADRRLPALHRLVAAGGTLVAHRPERRGVVRRPDGRWTKVVTEGRGDALARTLRQGGSWPGVRVPQVASSDAGSVTLETLPGTTLHALLAAPGADLEAAGRAVGEALARLHALPVPGGVPHHALADEAVVTERWLTLAAEHARPVPDHAAALADVRRLATAHRADPGRRAVLHRDLHDKQLLLDGDEVGLLDLDLLAAGDPALDLANLLVHLELRARQGVLTVAAAARAVRGVLSGYRPPPEVRAGLPVHARLTRLRLAAVYAFRPGSAAAARHLPTHPLLEELPC